MQHRCVICEADFEAKRATAKYCSDRCKKRKQRGAKVIEMRPQAVRTDSGTVETATRAELAAAERTDSHLGSLALALARRIDERQGTDQGAASLSKELRAVMAEALQDVKQAADPLDELRALRDRKRNAG